MVQTGSKLLQAKPAVQFKPEIPSAVVISDNKFKTETEAKQSNKKDLVQRKRKDNRKDVIAQYNK